MGRSLEGSWKALGGWAAVPSRGRVSLRMMSNTDAITNSMLSESVAHVACA